MGKLRDKHFVDIQLSALHQMLEGSRHSLIIEWRSIGRYTKSNVPLHSALLKFTLYVHGVETPNMQLCSKGILLYYLNH